MKQQNENSLILEYNQVPANLKDTFLENCSKKEIEIISKYEEDLLEKIKNEPSQIKNIENLSENLQLKAIENNIGAMIFIENPTEKVQIEGLKRDKSVVGCIRVNLKLETCYEALKENPYLLNHCLEIYDTTNNSTHNGISKEDIISTAIRSFEKYGKEKDNITYEISNEDKNKFVEKYESDCFSEKLSEVLNDKDINNSFKEKISEFLKEKEENYEPPLFDDENEYDNYDSLDSVE